MLVSLKILYKVMFKKDQKLLLKVVFLVLDGNVHIKSAYEANSVEVAIYEELGK